MIVALALLLVTPSAPAKPEKQRVLVLDLRNDGAKVEHARLVTDNIVVSLSRFSELEVVSSEDVRRMVQTEGEKQSLGCTEDSCLTEVASAMGASLVVHGSIGRLESLTIVNLSLYDSKAGKSIGREALRVQRLDDLPYMVEDATARLVRPLLGGAPVQSSTGTSTDAPPAKAAPPPDAGGVNRALAGGIAGVGACCLAVPLVTAVALTGPCGCFTLCTLTPAVAGVAGAGAALLGGRIGGANMGSLLVPALVGAGTGIATGAVGAAIAFYATQLPPEGIGAFTYVPSFLLASVPIGLLTGAAAGITTAIMADAPAAEPTPAPQAQQERALEKLPAGRYAMAY